MPTYDYICLDCHKRFEIYLSYSEYGARPVACPHCQSDHVRRRVPRVRVAKSEESRMDSLAGDFSDPSALAGLEDDPQAMGRMIRKMGKELGEEMPPEFDEVIDRLEKGQSPEEIEKEIPDLGGEGMGDADMGMGGMDF
ncbi:MAG: zinc ribbon domain-containing protein [Anaerolineales bacterium]|nr:zinc ribbon domain-containing protein [Anaerolineales bacterium]